MIDCEVTDEGNHYECCALDAYGHIDHWIDVDRYF
jgi:hypothetical protein